MSSLAERKCALFLTTLRASDRRRLLQRLPDATARQVKSLLNELESLAFDVAGLAAEVLGDEVRGLTTTTTIDLSQLVALSDRLSPPWFARVVAVWPNLDRNFCLSMLEAPVAAGVKRELTALGTLPPRLAEALKSEALTLANQETGA